MSIVHVVIVMSANRTSVFVNNQSICSADKQVKIFTIFLKDVAKLFELSVSTGEKKHILMIQLCQHAFMSRITPSVTPVRFQCRWRCFKKWVF